MSALKFIKKVVFEVESYDFEDFIKREYGKDYSFVADIECGNDSVHEFEIDAKSKINSRSKDVDLFRKTGHYHYLARVLLEDLANRKLIEYGTYIIQVCW